jgi:hypothetical protein
MSNMIAESVLILNKKCPAEEKFRTKKLEFVMWRKGVVVYRTADRSGMMRCCGGAGGYVVAAVVR